MILTTIAVAVVAAAAKATKNPTLMEKAIQWAQIAGGLAALSAVAVFAWAKLRLDKLWGWVFKHLKEDQAVARKKELLESMRSPELVALRQTDLRDALSAEFGPELDSMKAAHVSLREGQSHLERKLMEHIASEDNALAAIGAQQAQIHIRIDEHMDREEKAAAENAVHLKAIVKGLDNIRKERVTLVQQNKEEHDAIWERLNQNAPKAI